MNARSPAYNVLLKFDALIRRSGLLVVPFADPQAHTAALQRLRGRHSGLAAARRFFAQCIRPVSGGAMATPLTETDLGLGTSWRQALRGEIWNYDDWRVPQIIVPESRRRDWPNTPEVRVRCEDLPDAEPQLKVLAPLETYDAHCYARSDLDPWGCLQWLHRPEPNAWKNHPCILPKPPNLEGVPSDYMAAELARARALGWVQNDRYYYIPPLDYDIEAVTKDQWRKGRAFPWERCADSQRHGPVDINGIVWVWDRDERHWDVQLPEYIRVSHDGRKLP
jgi:hypothetical protein